MIYHERMGHSFLEMDVAASALKRKGTIQVVFSHSLKASVPNGTRILSAYGRWKTFHVSANNDKLHPVPSCQTLHILSLNKMYGTGHQKLINC